MVSSQICNNYSSLFYLKFYISSVATALQSKSSGFEVRDVKKLIRHPLDFAGLSMNKSFPKKFNSFGDMYLNKNFLVDIEQLLRQIVIFKASSMARLWGQNLAFPYVSLELREFLRTLPHTFKTYGSNKDWRRKKGMSKYVHKMALEGKVPSGVATQGGFTPLPAYFSNTETVEKIKRVILQSDIMSSVLNKKHVSEFIFHYDKFSAKTNHWFWQQHVESFKYFNLLVAVVWWEQVVNKRKGTTLDDYV